jgi:hypothetical protein
MTPRRGFGWACALLLALGAGSVRAAEPCPAETVSCHLFPRCGPVRRLLGLCRCPTCRCSPCATASGYALPGPMVSPGAADFAPHLPTPSVINYYTPPPALPRPTPNPYPPPPPPPPPPTENTSRAEPIVTPVKPPPLTPPLPPPPVPLDRIVSNPAAVPAQIVSRHAP